MTPIFEKSLFRLLCSKRQCQKYFVQGFLISCSTNENSEIQSWLCCTLAQAQLIASIIELFSGLHVSFVRVRLPSYLSSPSFLPSSCQPRILFTTAMAYENSAFVWIHVAQTNSSLTQDTQTCFKNLVPQNLFILIRFNSVQLHHLLL